LQVRIAEVAGAVAVIIIGKETFPDLESPNLFLISNIKLSEIIYS
jgi:hypothetical protein